ncbi:Short C-terminal domain-containing protein [Flavobacterium sp. 9R]|nr:Short C-terminal domain-containing protein [Flavobacterium sp. 9R]
MANCSLCSKELNFMNTPGFSAGKLSDGGTVCIPCFKKIIKINPITANRLKKHTLSEINDLLQEKNSSLEEIKKQIKAINLHNSSVYLGRREINELPNILASTEKIDNIAQGTYNNGQGILVSTNRRLIFVDKGIIFGLKVEDFPLDKISSIQYETGLLLGSIKIFTTGNVAKIDNVEKSSAKSFSEFVRDKLSQPKEVITSTIISEPSILDQLEKLAKLKESGILTEDEFFEQKKKLLEKL